jgi:uncharacterized membrane protein
LTPQLDALRRSFWLPAAVSLALGLALGLLMPSVDEWTAVDVPVVEIESDFGSSLLETIATVTMSVIGISFSVIVVALQLASQQLSPRVLRTFQTDVLSKIVLSLLVGTFIYCLAVMSRLGLLPDRTPELSVSVAIALAVASMGVFVRFVHSMVDLLQASTVIRRIGEDSQHAERTRYPAGVGGEPANPAEAAERIEQITATAPVEIRARRAGYLTGVDGEAIMERAAACGVLVRQCIPIGDFVVTGMRVAEVWGERAEDFVEAGADTFEVAEERTVAYDPAFPVRQLADVALRALSPSLNDPTTAENAMGTLTESLVQLADGSHPSPVRVDGDGTPRFVARVVTLDELVRLGFEQVRLSARSHPVFRDRLVVLLDAIQSAARRQGSECREAGRQAALLSSS